MVLGLCLNDALVQFCQTTLPVNEITDALAKKGYDMISSDESAIACTITLSDLQSRMELSHSLYMILSSWL